MAAWGQGSVGDRGSVVGIAAAAMLREVRRWQYGGGETAVAAVVWRWWQCGGGGIAVAAEAWQRWRQGGKRSGQHGTSAAAAAAEGAPFLITISPNNNVTMEFG